MATSVYSPAYEEELLPEYEEEFEDESHLAGEDEEEISPIRKVYSDAMMEHLGELAAEAETEDEAAEHFLPLIGMAASKLLPVVAKAVAPAAKRALPKIAKAVTKLTPSLTRGVGKIARQLHRKPATRHLLKAVPGIARKTVHSIAKQAAHNRHVTPRKAIRTLVHHTRRALGHPRRRAHMLRRHRHLDRRFHRGLGRRLVRPHHGMGVAGVHTHGGVPGVGRIAGRGVRPGRLAGKGGVCPPCPSCAGTGSAVSAAPAYCRCCGQVLR
jgi:hypothetical protein